MSDTRFHPDFEAAPAAHRFTGKLAELVGELRRYAWKLDGEFVWRVLPHGALVAMQVCADQGYRKRIRIARRAVPTDEKAWLRWQQEVATFAKHLGCEGWTRAETEGRAEVFFLELEPYSDSRTPATPCARCGKPAEPKGPYKEPICNACAMELGRQEAAANNASLKLL